MDHRLHKEASGCLWGVRDQEYHSSGAGYPANTWCRMMQSTWCPNDSSPICHDERTPFRSIQTLLHSTAGLSPCHTPRKKKMHRDQRIDGMFTPSKPWAQISDAETQPQENSQSASMAKADSAFNGRADDVEYHPEDDTISDAERDEDIIDEEDDERGDRLIAFKYFVQKPSQDRKLPPRPRCRKPPPASTVAAPSLLFSPASSFYKPLPVGAAAMDHERLHRDFIALCSTSMACGYAFARCEPLPVGAAAGVHHAHHDSIRLYLREYPSTTVESWPLTQRWRDFIAHRHPIGKHDFMSAPDCIEIGKHAHSWLVKQEKAVIAVRSHDFIVVYGPSRPCEACFGSIPPPACRARPSYKRAPSNCSRLSIATDFQSPYASNHLRLSTTTHLQSPQPSNMTINFLPIFDSWCGENGARWYPCFMITKSRGTPATNDGHVQTGKTCKHDDFKNPPPKDERMRRNAAVSDAYEARDFQRLRHAIRHLLELVMCPSHKKDLESGKSKDEVREWVDKLAEMVLWRKPDDAVPKFDESIFGPGRRVSRKRKLSSDPSGSRDGPQWKIMRSDAKASPNADAGPDFSISNTNSANGLSSSNSAASNLDALFPDLFDTANLSNQSSSASSFSSGSLDPALLVNDNSSTRSTSASSFSSSSLDPALRGPVNSENQPYFTQNLRSKSAEPAPPNSPEASFTNSGSLEPAVHDHANHLSNSASPSHADVSQQAKSTGQASSSSDNFNAFDPVTSDPSVHAGVIDNLPVCSFCGRDAFQHHKPLCDFFQSQRTWVPLSGYCSSGRCAGGPRSFCNEDTCWDLWCENATHLRWCGTMHAYTCFRNPNMIPADDSTNSTSSADESLAQPSDSDSHTTATAPETEVPAAKGDSNSVCHGDSDVAQIADELWDEWVEIGGPEIMNEVTAGPNAAAPETEAPMAKDNSNSGWLGGDVGGVGADWRTGAWVGGVGAEWRNVWEEVGGVGTEWSNVREDIGGVDSEWRTLSDNGDRARWVGRSLRQNQSQERAERHRPHIPPKRQTIALRNDYTSIQLPFSLGTFITDLNTSHLDTSTAGWSVQEQE
ncbi:uncharacterized protein MYCFIDRAFT_180047 [Pseudocercospora fijiensis CIRAD86]|uniref:Uncharacterized protein n=1 Tax=Pseudocercospora fijiensis (strain CIRAD86) TaxID=383855 RepID=M2ZYI1_PSEFD|nr:uncharacterized protein MYCFIDRAFT_180047 [Pseudocercospora fijiensis CIRAD86]EME77171.1 hypothetical protein MYCFIDRAFT_180047 [Pseudocercospora fijiensis CIRAD86]